MLLLVQKNIVVLKTEFAVKIFKELTFYGDKSEKNTIYTSQYIQNIYTIYGEHYDLERLREAITPMIVTIIGESDSIMVKVKEEEDNIVAMANFPEYRPTMITINKNCDCYEKIKHIFTPLYVEGSVIYSNNEVVKSNTKVFIYEADRQDT